MRFGTSEIRSQKSEARRGFSLIEVMLSVFILGIGLIMVATIFPVGADWTRQTAQNDVAQTVAQNALSVIQATYGPNGSAANQLSSITGGLQALPSMSNNLPVSERCY